MRLDWTERDAHFGGMRRALREISDIYRGRAFVDHSVVTAEDCSGLGKSLPENPSGRTSSQHVFGRFHERQTRKWFPSSFISRSATRCFPAWFVRRDNNGQPRPPRRGFSNHCDS